MTVDYYNVKSHPPGYRVTKFDADLNVESSYTCSTEGCTCPAGHRSSCRHREMTPMFVANGHVDDNWFLNWQTRKWMNPVDPKLLAKVDEQLGKYIEEDLAAQREYAESVEDAFTNMIEIAIDELREEGIGDKIELKEVAASLPPSGADDLTEMQDLLPPPGPASEPSSAPLTHTSTGLRRL